MREGREGREAGLSVERVLRAQDIDDLTRFHEAVDQTLAESHVRFEAGVEHRELPRTVVARGPTGSLGIGLHITERIVHAYGVSIAVDSSEAGGTTFSVRLPCRAVAAASS